MINFFMKMSLYYEYIFFSSAFRKIAKHSMDLSYYVFQIEMT